MSSHYFPHHQWYDLLVLLLLTSRWDNTIAYPSPLLLLSSSSLFLFISYRCPVVSSTIAARRIFGCLNGCDVPSALNAPEPVPRRGRNTKAVGIQEGLRDWGRWYAVLPVWNNRSSSQGRTHVRMSSYILRWPYFALHNKLIYKIVVHNTIILLYDSNQKRIWVVYVGLMSIRIINQSTCLL